LRYLGAVALLVRALGDGVVHAGPGENCPEPLAQQRATSRTALAARPTSFIVGDKSCGEKDLLAGEETKEEALAPGGLGPAEPKSVALWDACRPADQETAMRPPATGTPGASSRHCAVPNGH
jgi:hypothetical protein